MWLIIFTAIVALIILILLYLLRPVYNPTRLVNLRDVHVVITGGSSGIGKELARQFLHDHQARVTILARNQQRLDECRQDLTPDNDERLCCLSVDVSRSYADVQKAIEKACQYHGNRPVSIVINNAGIFYAKTFDETTAEDFEQMGKFCFSSKRSSFVSHLLDSSSYQLSRCCLLYKSLSSFDASAWFWSYCSRFFTSWSSGCLRLHILLCNQIRSQRSSRITSNGISS